MKLNTNLRFALFASIHKSLRNTIACQQNVLLGKNLSSASLSSATQTALPLTAFN